MPRAKKTRISEGDEIPLAYRPNPIRIRFGTNRFTAFFSFVLIISVVLFFSNIKSEIFFNEGSIPADDGRLLGHFPYKEAQQADLISVYPGFKVHRDVIKDLQAMRKAAFREGIELVLLSGYRSIPLQKEIFYENKSIRNQIAIERARVSAPPGYSEHSTGFAIDIGDRTMRKTDFEVEFENTPAFNWLKKNAARFHFVLSFPEGNSQNVSYEPWHWRYEGSVNALREFEPANKRQIEWKQNQDY